MARVKLRRDARGRYLKRGSNPPRRKRRRNDPGPRSRGRRRFRRNPPFFSPGNIMGQMMGGAQDGAVVLVGDGLSSVIVNFIPGQDKSTPVGMLLKGAAGVGLGMVAGMMGFPQFSRLLIAGAFYGIGRTIITTKVQIPVISPALSDYPMEELSAYPALEAYPTGSQQVDIYRTSLASYPQYAGLQ